MQGYTISNNKHDFDFDLIYAFLATSYWAKGMPKAVLSKAIENSFCFAVFNNNGEQVGFARLITDKATFAYLADVFIVESHRGLGLSKWLVETIVGHQDLQGLRRMVLATRDAHSLYAQYGFKPVENPEILMQIWQPDIYQQ
ncbi:GNAT family N-acetyltransferase [Thalassotalea sp. 42_200_T64]|nr:GNAT family N-acetyltransferase [Thalassotalea sp. 42_200_T64]